MTDRTIMAPPVAGRAAASPARRRLRLVVVGVVCGGYGLCAIAIYSAYFARNPLMDWMVYYEAARAYLDGDLTLIFDGARFTATLNAHFAVWLAQPLPFQPWLYPPHYLLLLVPFGLLPFAVSGVLFLAGSFAGLMAAIRGAVARGGRWWLHLGSLLLAPASVFNAGSGQNGFLTAALLVGGFGVLERRPLLAGALLGALTYKPQFWLLTPLALVASRHWRALASAAATAVILMAASVAAFGLEPWALWPIEIHDIWLRESDHYGQSVSACLAVIGASHGIAAAAQLAATAAAGVAVWWCYSRPQPRGLRLAVLLAATVLAAPRVTGYDAVLLVVAATIVFADELDRGISLAGIVVPVLVWMIQLFDPPGVFRVGAVTPLLTALLVAVALVRMPSGRTPVSVEAGVAHGR